MSSGDIDRSGGGRAGRSGPLGTITGHRLLAPAVAVLVAVLSWPFIPSRGGVGLDLSWQAGLAMAWHQGIDWGSNLYFTYGPLGFLTAVPYDAEYVLTGPVPWYGGTYAASVWFLFAQWIGIALLLVVASRSALGVPGAASAAYAALALAPLSGPETGAMLAVGAALLVLRAQPDARTRPLLLCALGCGAALLLLMKTTLGVIALIAVIAAAAGLARRWQDAAAGAAGVVVGFAALWLLTGQPVTGAMGWMWGSVSMATGFSGAMWLAGDGRDVGTAVILCAATIWLAVRASRGLPGRSRAAMVVLVAATVWMLFQASFVRHDAQHAMILYAAIGLVALLLCWRRDVRVHALVIVGAGVAMFAIASGTDWTARIDPTERVAALRNQLGTTLTAHRQQVAVGETRATVAKGLRIPERLLEGPRRAGLRVNVDPWELTGVWASGLRWRPLPGFQRYSMYTATVDQDAAGMLASDDAPDVIFRHEGAVLDARYPPFDGPQTYLAMLCEYRSIAVVDGWQRLDRSSNRCGPELPMQDVRVADGETVAVPASDERSIVVARFSGGEGAPDGLFSSPFSRPGGGPVITVDGTPYRFIPGTEGGPHVLSVPPVAGWRGPFAQPAATSIGLSGTGDVEVTFSRIPLARGS